MKSMSEFKVSGSLAAVFISSSITSLLIGILVYIRKLLPFLEVYSAAGTLSGIWLYSYVIWIILWLLGYAVLRTRKEVGSLRTWVIVFALSVIIGTLLTEASLKWSSLFG